MPMTNLKIQFIVRMYGNVAVIPLTLVGFATTGLQIADGATAVSRIFGAVPVVAQG